MAKDRNEYNAQLDAYAEKVRQEELEEIEANILVVEEVDLDLAELWAAEEAARNFSTTWFID